MARSTDDIPQNVNFAIKATVAADFLDARGVRYTEGRLGLLFLRAISRNGQGRSLSTLNAALADDWMRRPAMTSAWDL